MKSIIVIFLMPMLIYAQQDPGSSLSLRGIIDKENAELDEALENCLGSDEPCGWYLNEIIINKGNEPWRAVGNYVEKIRFWYSEEPRFANAEDENANELWPLRKVEVQITSNSEEMFSFYLFQGELTCYAHKYFGPDEEVFENIYFHQKEIIEWDGEPNELNEEQRKVKTGSILDALLYFQELFLSLF